jgi:uncharacterized damage-inducible protein DinB
MTEAIAEILGREIGKLRGEVEAYPGDEAVWRVAPGIANSAGTLVLHLCGNLRHFVGAQLGGTGYARDRDAEFARRGVPRPELLAEIARAEREVGETLARLGDDDLARPYPLEVFGRTDTTGWMLLHLVQHFTYHLGQVNYHRRLLGGSAEATA